MDRVRRWLRFVARKENAPGSSTETEGLCERLIEFREDGRDDDLSLEKDLGGDRSDCVCRCALESGRSTVENLGEGLGRFRLDARGLLVALDMLLILLLAWWFEWVPPWLLIGWVK